MIKNIVFSVVGVLILVVAAFLIWAASYPDLSKSKTVGGEDRYQSMYLTMRDGVKIAVEVWLPESYEAGQKLPTLVMGSRYSRLKSAYQLTIIDKIRIRLGDVDKRQVPYKELDPEAIWANEAGYAVIFIDARGSSASFGTRPIEWSPDEIDDYSEVITWAANQSWSNGKIGAWGTSYPGNTAELMASTGNQALKAVAPRFSDFDPLIGVGMPGGLRADGFLNQWSDLNASFDSMPQLSKPVSDDKNKKLLEEAIASHDNPNIAESIRAITYRDDEYAKSGLTFSDVSPFGLKSEIEANNTPMQIWVSWLDAATMDGAISRYLTFSNPQQVIIGPWNHGGSPSIDPFSPDPMPSDHVDQMLANIDAMKPQMAQVLDYFDCHLKDMDCEEMESEIIYYTFNSGEWSTTKVWPPEGFDQERFYLGDDGKLTQELPSEISNPDEYTVDFTTTTGTSNRWFAQMGMPIDYTADRAEEDTKLLTYTSEPLSADTEITGSPIITLNLTSTEEDCAFHVYLEDVAPDGKVTYITEGIIRSIHHAESKDEAPFVHIGPYHSFNRADAAPLEPGEITEIQLKLYATSVLIEEGHSIRIAIAGADADTFARYPQEGTPVWQVYHSNLYPSFIELPMKTN